ncbi:hypothetical protein [Caballeronia sp. GAWG1-1]|uniref:hypothetical protein n=1 Tax=Caballeronia sp. GAWG1-1 TaxID=2921742 RepID=UPI0020277CAB|nr:hypothetical protein [Caballeronia sp. GAWG1-1]
MLYLEFELAEQRPNPVPFDDIDSRRAIVEWLEANHVEWTRCGHVASTTVMRSYAGQIYIDVPYDVDDPTYQKLQQFLEFEDGTMRYDGVRFWIFPLDKAMENAYHDEPGFWERWADNF